MPGPTDNPIITLMVALLFVLGVLYKNWVVEMRDWISSKVSN